MHRKHLHSHARLEENKDGLAGGSTGYLDYTTVLTSALASILWSGFINRRCAGSCQVNH